MLIELDFNRIIPTQVIYDESILIWLRRVCKYFIYGLLQHENECMQKTTSTFKFKEVNKLQVLGVNDYKISN